MKITAWISEWKNSLLSWNFKKCIVPTAMCADFGIASTRNSREGVKVYSVDVKLKDLDPKIIGQAGRPTTKSGCQGSSVCRALVS